MPLEGISHHRLISARAGPSIAMAGGAHSASRCDVQNTGDTHEKDKKSLMNEEIPTDQVPESPTIVAFALEGYEDNPPSEDVGQVQTSASMTCVGKFAPEDLMDENKGWIEERTATEIVESIKEKHPSMSEQQIDFVSRTLKDRVRVPPKDAQSDEPNADSQVRAIGVTGEELLEQFREQGGLDKLEAAILLLRHSLELCATKNPTRPIVLSALATALVTKYEQLANNSVLEEAISLHRKALELCPHGHTCRFKLLNHLADALLTQYEHYGNSSVWEEVVRLLREALKLLPPGHPKRGPLLNSLAKALLTHYQMTSSKDANLLEEAIRLYNDALELFSREHPNHELLSANLAYALLKQSEHLGNINTVEEQTGLFRKILEYFPHGHPERGTALNNLALILQNRHERTGDAQTLVEATGLFHEALELRPHAHPHHDKVLMNLVKCYWNNFFHDHDEIHLVNALELCKEALNTRPIGHPSRCYTHQAIAFMYLVKTSFFDWSAGLSHLKDAAEDNHASPRYRLEKFRLPLRQLERISTCNIDEYFYSQPALDVYTAVIQLLPRVAHLGLDPSNRLQELSGSENMSRAAAMRAMLLDQIPLAIEIYEEGKAVFWLQALRLRSTELNSLPPSDRDELLRLFRLLEQESPIFTGDVTDEAKMESWTSYRRQLSEQSENLIGQIRLRPGFERFLRIPRFDELVEAANSGFVVLLVANEPIFFFAIIIHPLGLLKPILLESVTGSMLQRLHTRLSGFGMRGFTCNMDSMSNDINRGMRAKLPNQGNPLEQMWQAIVEPVISGIGSKKATGRKRLRVHWYPSGDFALLPLHAAGIYEGKDKVCAADFIVSSYTPSLSSLIRSRESFKPLPRHELRCLISGESAASGLNPIPEVAKEVNIVTALMMSVSATVVNDPLAPPKVDTVLEQVSTAHVLHLACHGHQAPDPLNSRFALSDGPLAISAFMKLHLPNAMLAFLSACETAKGDKDQPDQVVHLAASMLFCGFRSVIATMWSMHDMDGPKVAQWFYEALLENEIIKLDDIPYALDEAVQKLRDTGASPARWATYMHFGA